MARAGVPETGRRRGLRARIRALPGGWIAWRIAVTIAGVAVIAVGVLLLPLPGPGWLIIFAGLGILASEYEWAARLLRWVRRQFVRWTEWMAAQPLWIRLVVSTFTLLFVIAILVAVWIVAGRPGL
jgi:uncharacterized protein (TIGR02611 family)